MNLVSPSFWGGLLVVLGSLLLYASSPNQRMLKRPLKAMLGGWPGLALLLAGAVQLFTWAGPATAIFILLTLVMFVWSIVPVAAAWLRAPRSE